MDQDKAREKRNREIAGYVMAACLLLGLGTGFLTKHLVAGLFIGMGVGLLGMALVRWRG